MTRTHPKVLHVDSSYSPLENDKTEIWDKTIDYRIYDHIPRWWRKIEEWLRLDFYLALRASRMASQFDIILAGSEKVGIPLSLLIKNRPIVTIVYHIASPLKRVLTRFLRAHTHWEKIGYLTEADKEFVESYFHVPSDRLFRHIAAPLGQFTPSNTKPNGPLISIGVSKRDYDTLLSALYELPDYPAEIYATSRFPDLYQGNSSDPIPEWIQFKDFVPHQNLAECYRQARFVVLPLHDTTQFSAGYSVALEAHAAGKAIISTDTRGMREYIIDGVTGILVPPHDPQAMREAIIRLWQNPDLAARMGLAGRDFVERVYSPAKNVAEIQQVLCSVYQKAAQQPSAYKVREPNA